MRRRFRNREDAALQLAEALKERRLVRPLVLAIPRGGVVIGAILARELGAECDVVLSRKLRAPAQPELAIGAISEDGRVFLDRFAEELATRSLDADYLAKEKRYQLAEIARRRELFRANVPQASPAGRSVIVTDDGIATGSTMLAALQVVKAHGPHELIVATPVAPPEELPEIRQACDDVICLLTPSRFWSIGEFYEDFTQVDDAEAVAMLKGVSGSCR